ncbi:MAG: hypothetical protein CMH54_07575 [Myxococcales bacterium]|nr:hypothetical protein [Myxococcales bacterium]
MTLDNTRQEAAVRRTPLLLIFPALWIGLAIAVYLAIMKSELDANILNTAKACGIDGGGCAKNQLSSYSSVFGVPIAIWAIPTYIVAAFLTGHALIKQKHEEFLARKTVSLVVVIGLMTTLYSLFLAYISFFVLEPCKFCMGLYAVNGSILVLSFMALHGSIPTVVQSLTGRNLATIRPQLTPIPQAGLIFVLALGAALVWFQRADGNMKQKKAAMVQQARQDTAARIKALKSLPLDDVEYSVWGPKDAAVTLVEFADFKCGHCALMAKHTLGPLKQKYKDKIRVVFRHYPLDSECNAGANSHPGACEAARAAHCAGKQGRFWQMHDLLFENQDNLKSSLIPKLAKKAGVQMATWEACLDDPATSKRIALDIDIANQAFIQGTPYIIVDRVPMDGWSDLEKIEALIDSALGEPPTEANKSIASSGGANQWGPDDAPVTLIEYSDFECSFCRMLAHNLKAIKKKYDDGQLRIIFRNFPLNNECNPFTGGARHKNACSAARAAHCAGEQGKFWEMHDLLFEKQSKLSAKDLESYAQKIGVDVKQWNTCLTSTETNQKIRLDAAKGAKKRIDSTPKVFINDRPMEGAGSLSILEYMIDNALKSSDSGSNTNTKVVRADDTTPTQVKITSLPSPFYIDAFEASVDGAGKAMSIPNALPAQLSWFEAKEACEKASKRLCTEKEWVTACAGKAAIDNNGNGYFADDTVEGTMYPYGLYYEASRCRANEDRKTGGVVNTGSLAGCRTASGIYDIVGNRAEWVGTDPKKATLVGGSYSSRSRAACNYRRASYGPGYRNATTGVRCCADEPVKGKADRSQVDESNTNDVVGRALPAKLRLNTEDSQVLESAWFKNKVTYITFFASWCGSCKRELPFLRKLQEEFGPKGFHVVAIGTDRLKKRTLDFVNQFDPNYVVVHDQDSSAMGLFNIDSMPASFLVDRKGVVQHRSIGFNVDEIPEIRERVEKLLNQ